MAVRRRLRRAGTRRRHQGSEPRRHLRPRFAIVLEHLEPRVLLTAYVVATLNDTIASDGQVSLREAITAAVLGVIANLAIWFGLHVLFTRDAMMTSPWGHTLGVPEVTSFDPAAALIALAAGVALMRFKANVVLVIMLCALAGCARLLLP